MRVGAYDIESEIGRGGGGTVFRARASDGRLVAMKVLHALGGDALHRFERESRLARTLGASEGFVPVLDAGQHGGAPFLVFPLVEGGTLRQRLDRGPLSLIDALSIGRAVARALGTAHARGIVHRDVKPENILFTADGTPLVADLGLAKHFDGAATGAGASRSLSAHGSLRGTAGYMPPEQMADAKSAGPPSDVFAAGCVLYECLCGQPPFAGETVIDIISKVERARFAAVRKLRPETPRAIERVVERALAHDPAARFQDGLALDRALAAASKPAPAPRAALVAGSVAVALLVAGAAFLASRGGPRSAPPPAPAPAPRPRVSAPESPRARVGALMASALAAQQRDDPAEVRRLTEEALALDPASADARALRIIASDDAWSDAVYASEVATALASDPSCPLALLARTVLRRGKAEAEAAASEALAADPDLEIGYLVRGYVRMSAGALDGARADAESAIRVGGLYARSWLLRAALRSRTGGAGWAEDLACALERAPRSASVRLNSATIRYDAGDLERALTDLERVLEVDPRSAPAFCYRGQVRARRGEGELAVADLSRAIELDPTLAQAWVFRAPQRRSAGDRERAASDAEHAIELAPRSGPEVYAATGLERSAHGHPAVARKMLEIAIAGGCPAILRPRVWRWLAEHPAKEDPPLDDYQGLIRDAREQLDVGAADFSIVLATRAIAAAPTAFEAWAVRAMARQQKTDLVRALADATQAVDLAPGTVRARAIRATVWIAMSDMDRALSDATAAIVSNPEDASAYQLRATVRRRMADADGALADCALGLRFAPDDGSLLYTLGMSLADKDRIDAARETFERLIRCTPETAKVRRFAREWLDRNPRR